LIWYFSCILREEIVMGKIEITEVALKRYQILSDVLKGELTLKEASNVLNLSYRQAIRLKKGLNKQGIKGLLKKARPKPPNLKIT
jgi:transposase